jgi:hypothetical protein
MVKEIGTDESIAPSAITLWCAGIPELGQRVLTAGELELIKSERRHALRKIRIYFLYIPGLAIVVALIAFLAGERGSDLMLSAALIGFLTILGLPLLIFPGTRQYKFANGLKNDLQHGSVYVFCGSPDNRLGDTPVISALVKNRLIDLKGMEELKLEVLEKSSYLFSAGGKVVLERSIHANIARVVNPPEFAQLAAKYVQPTDEPGISRHQRNLNEEEVEEMNHHYRRSINVRSIIWTLVLVLFGPFPLIYQILRREEFSAMAGPIFISLLAALSILRLSKNLRISFKLKQDLKDGFVFIEQRITDNASENGNTYEYLPHTQFLWTENHRPAAWRTY